MRNMLMELTGSTSVSAVEAHHAFLRSRQLYLTGSFSRRTRWSDAAVNRVSRGFQRAANRNSRGTANRFALLDSSTDNSLTDPEMPELVSASEEEDAFEGGWIQGRLLDEPEPEPEPCAMPEPEPQPVRSSLAITLHDCDGSAATVCGVRE